MQIDGVDGADLATFSDSPLSVCAHVDDATRAELDLRLAHLGRFVVLRPADRGGAASPDGEVLRVELRRRADAGLAVGHVLL